MVRTALIAGILGSLLTAAAADARTTVATYSPFTPGGALAPGLTATRASGGGCQTGSFVVSGPTAYRCFVRDEIRDPCYLDAAASTQAHPVVICVAAPWDTRVVRLRITEGLDHSGGVGPGTSPWALRLSSGARCAVAQGATGVVHGRRLTYTCTGRRYLFGRPDHSRPTWRIRQAATPAGTGARMVGIRRAWR